MHWLSTPSSDLSPETSPSKDTTGHLTLHVLIFHDNKTLLLHNAQQNKWVLPHSALLPNSTAKTMQALYDSKSTSGSSLQDIAIQSLEQGFRDSVLDNLQFHDLVFDKALTIPKQEGNGEDLLLITSISAILPHKLKRGDKDLFTLNPLSEPQYDDIRLCTIQDAVDLLPPETGRLAEHALQRYLAASSKALVLDLPLQPWIENVLSTYIHCQFLHQGQRYFDRLPEEFRKHPVEEVIRDYKTAICSKGLTGGGEELVVYPLTLEGFDWFSERVGLWEMRWVGSHVWRDGELRFEWVEGVRGEWVTEEGRLRVGWI